MLSFIIFEIVAQAYLVATFWSFKEKLKDYINLLVLNLKIMLVSILIIVAVISIPIISLPGDDFFGIQFKVFKTCVGMGLLYWGNHFLFINIFYVEKKN